jgi:hypothetical protein
MENEMITLQAEPPLYVDALPSPAADRSPPAARTPQAAAILGFGGWTDPLVPSSVVGVSLALAQASMLWPVLRPV